MPLQIDWTVVASNGIWCVLFVALLVWLLRRLESQEKQTREDAVKAMVLAQAREDKLREEAKAREERLLGIIDCYNVALEKIAEKLGIDVPVIPHSAPHVVKRT